MLVTERGKIGENKEKTHELREFDHGNSMMEDIEACRYEAI